MPDFRDIQPDYEQQHATWRGVIAKDAEDENEELPVILPDWDPDLQWGPCEWTFKDNVNLPKRGDDCLVVFDNNHKPWIASWSQSTDYISPWWWWWGAYPSLELVYRNS